MFWSMFTLLNLQRKHTHMDELSNHAQQRCSGTSDHTSHSWPIWSAESAYMRCCVWHAYHLLQYLSASTPRSSFFISLHCQNDVSADLHEVCGKLARNSAKWEYLHTRGHRTTKERCSWKTWRPSAGQQRCGQWVLRWLFREELIRLFYQSAVVLGTSVMAFWCYTHSRYPHWYQLAGRRVLPRGDDDLITEVW